jgi:hypothetical protein
VYKDTENGKWKGRQGKKEVLTCGNRAGWPGWRRSRRQ